MIISCTLLRGSDTLIVGYTPAPPFIIEDQYEKSGVSIWLWEQISKDLNLEFVYATMEFSEILSGLEDGSVDVSINPLTMTSSRSQQFLFTSPFYVSNGAVVIRSLGSWNTAINVIKTAFSREFLSALVLLLLIIAFFGWMLWLFERDYNKEEFRPGMKGVWDGFWWSAVTMTTVGYGDKSVKSFGGKVVALIWMFTALIFISGLTASIASTILFQQDSKTVIKLTDLTDKKVGTVKNTSMEIFLKKKFFRNIVPYDDINIGLQDVQNKNIEAFIYDEPIMKYRLGALDNNECIILDISFDQQLYAFGLSKKNLELQNKMIERILFYTNTLDWNVLINEHGLDIK